MAKNWFKFQVKEALYQPVRATLTAKFFKKISNGWVSCQKGVPLQQLEEEGENSKVWTSQETDVQHKNSFQKIMFIAEYQ